MYEVRVWTVRAVSSGAVWQTCFQTLSTDERARALRMRAGLPRDEFVTGRALLRCLLRQELEQEAREIVLREGPRGKPRVDGISFNVAHAGGLVVIAVCLDGEVGIDIERVDAGVKADEIAEAHFAAGEQAALAGSNDPAREFVRIWTRKEAVVKALGVGLGMRLNTFDVASNNRVEIEGDVIFLQDLVVASGWLGCVASLGCAREIKAASLDEKELLTLLCGTSTVSPVEVPRDCR